MTILIDIKPWAKKSQLVIFRDLQTTIFALAGVGVAPK